MNLNDTSLVFYGYHGRGGVTGITTIYNLNEFFTSILIRLRTPLFSLTTETNLNLTQTTQDVFKGSTATGRDNACQLSCSSVHLEQLHR